MDPLPHALPPTRDTLVRELLPVVGAWCRRLGGRGVDPEEAAHDVILAVLRRADTRGPGVSLETYAWGVTRRVLANHRRRAWWRRWMAGEPEASAAPGGPLLDAERRDAARRVAALLDELPQAQREVLVLCDVEERTSAEAATLLGVPEGTVRSRLRLGRARFRELAPRFHLHPCGDAP